MDEMKGRGLQWIRGFLLLLLAAGIGLCGYMAWFPDDRGAWIVAIVGQAVILAIILRFFLIRLKAGVPEITLSANDVPVGGEVRVTWRQPFRGATRVRKATLKLVFREKAVSGSGKHRTTHQDDTVVQQVDSPGRDFQPGEELVVSGQFRVPPTGMHTFAAGSNWLSWRIESALEIDGWPDDWNSRPLMVRPGLER